MSTQPERTQHPQSTAVAGEDDHHGLLHHGPRLPDGIYNALHKHARRIGAFGAGVTALSCLLPWAYLKSVLGDLTYVLNPAPLQYAMLALPLLVGVLLAVTPRAKDHTHFLNPGSALRTSGLAVLGGAFGVLAAITVETGALANADYGIAATIIGGACMAIAGFTYPRELTPQSKKFPHVPPTYAALILVALVAAALLVCAFVLGEDDPWTFFLIMGALSALAAVVSQSGLGAWLGDLAGKQRSVLLLSTFAAAFSLPLTQDGSDALMSVATQVLIFAATAVGLNIVVGLAGLLDLGYIAFLGAGAYVGALLSGSVFSAIDWKPPFLITVVIGAIFSSILGLIIGSPTLRVSGDYLAIVTLAFGEIFRLAMLNLDENPNLTGGPNGIPSIPDLNFFGFDFGETHHFFGIPITKFGNYYLLLLVVLGIIILVFNRLNTSRIGRGWVAIREDEKAAEAMGVNVFGLKLLAFSGGAALAGMAGTIKAHVDVSVTPDQYIFLESAFLLAAVVLGGMGTVSGVLIGAIILKLLPEKLRFFSEYRLLMFGLLLVIMMRFRPQGLIEVHRRHPADDYPQALEEGRSRPIEGTILKGVSR